MERAHASQAARAQFALWFAPRELGVWGDMVDRKPPGVSVGSWIEAQISAAMQDGAFDNLPGAGKPLAISGEGYDPDRWVKQLMEREGAHATPPSLELRRKVEKELAAIETLDDAANVRARLAALNAEIGAFNARAVDGPPTNIAPLDIEQAMARWRQARTLGAALDAVSALAQERAFGPQGLTLVRRDIAGRG